MNAVCKEGGRGPARKVKILIRSQMTSEKSSKINKHDSHTIKII